MTPSSIDAARAAVRQAIALGDGEVDRLTTDHVNGKLVQALGLFGYLRHFRRAEGMHLWDSAGRRYLDFLAGYGAVPLGHNPPEVRAAIEEALAASLPHFLLVAPEAMPAALARRLADLLPGDLGVTCFSSSGSEAVDAALKLARAASKRERIVHAEQAYHGSTYGALSVTSSPFRRSGFEPLLPCVTSIPWNDAAAVDRELRRRDVAAVILEPIQAEGGMRLPAPGWLSDVARSCRRTGTLLVLDEVQTGLGRTGTLFACQAEGVEPDVVVLAKGLSGGLVPIASTTTRPDLWRRAYGTLERHEAHCSTFRGGPLACAAAIATLDAIVGRALPAHAHDVGQYLGRRLREITRGHPLVRDVRGRGLLWGIELATPEQGIAAAFVAQWLVVGLLERGVVTQVTSLQPNVVRLEPPLVCTRDDVDVALAALDETLATHATGRLRSFVGAAARLVENGVGALLERRP